MISKKHPLMLAVLCMISFLNPPAALGMDIEWTVPKGKTAPLKVALTDIENPELLTKERLQTQFKVYVIQQKDSTDIEIPILGKYTLIHDGIEFTPRFPFIDRMIYRAVYKSTESDSEPGKTLVSVWKYEGPRKKPSTFIKQVYPSSDVVPENLLKFYLYFSNPMSGGDVYQYIHLMDKNGHEIELPFLELGQELWDPPMRRLTLFIDPGRIKRGVKPLEDIGPSLVAGHQYKLIIDAEWLDAKRLPLMQSFEKQFTVGTPDRTAIDPKLWKLSVPKSGTRKPLMIRFGEAMDFALAQRLIEVFQDDERPTNGTILLSNHETVWSFTPIKAWQAGRYYIRVGTILEDLAGNNIGKPFEVDVFDSIQRWITEEYIDLPFIIH